MSENERPISSPTYEGVIHLRSQIRSYSIRGEMCRNVEWSVTSSITRCRNRALEIIKELRETLPKVILWWPILPPKGQLIHDPVVTTHLQLQNLPVPSSPVPELRKESANMRNMRFLSHTIGDVTLLLAVLLDEPLWCPRAPKFILQSSDNERLSFRPDGPKVHVRKFREVVDRIAMATNARGVFGSSFGVLVDACVDGIE